LQNPKTIAASKSSNHVLYVVCSLLMGYFESLWFPYRSLTAQKYRNAANFPFVWPKYEKEANQQAS